MRSHIVKARTILLLSGRKAAAGIAGMVFGSLLGFSLILWSSRSDPVTINSAYELDTAVSHDGHFDIVFDISRQRDCASETSRWLWTWVNKDGRRMKQFFPLLNTTTSLTGLGNEQRFILSLPLPQGIWPGEWFYWAKTVEHCSSWLVTGSRVVETPPIPIKIGANP